MNKRQTTPTTFITPLNYSENKRSAARTEILPQYPTLIAILTSLLLRSNSLFL